MSAYLVAGRPNAHGQSGWVHCAPIDARGEAALGPLLPLFQRERAAERAVALGVLVGTLGSTYRKPGAMILCSAGNGHAGLISGGCLESDLGEHGRAVIASGQARLVRYDLRGSEDLLWGLGLGCEGAMDIVLMRAGPETAWQPLAHMAAALQAHTATAIGFVTHSSDPELPCGSLAFPGVGEASAGPLRKPAVEDALKAAAATGICRSLESEAWSLFVLPLVLPPRILVLGAGPDAAPVVDLAARMGWKVTVADHRAAYAAVGHFPAADRVLHVQPTSLGHSLALDEFDAAVVMSHHLASDLAYLRTLAGSCLGYVGLLGPPARRERLLADLGPSAVSLRRRLRAPVGLPLGGRAPASIALAIVAELHAYLHDRPESARSGLVGTEPAGPRDFAIHELSQPQELS
jgi:xanthine dehydrogenase accessory factor